MLAGQMCAPLPPQKNEIRSEQCQEAAAHWEICVMIRPDYLQDWQLQSFCHPVLNVIGAELWWQQKLPQCGWALFLAVKL